MSTNKHSLFCDFFSVSIFIFFSYLTLSMPKLYFPFNENKKPDLICSVFISTRGLNERAKMQTLLVFFLFVLISLLQTM